MVENNMCIYRILILMNPERDRYILIRGGDESDEYGLFYGYTCCCVVISSSGLTVVRHQFYGGCKRSHSCRYHPPILIFLGCCPPFY